MTLFDIAPSDDAGAEAQNNFRWQHNCAARDCILMLTEATIVRVVCEIHEDHILEHDDGSLTLVSAKHRDGSQGPWTLNAISSRGLAHLFDRWHPVRDTGRARIMTNAALKSGAKEARSVQDACDALADVRAGRASRLSEADVDQAHDALVQALLAARRTRQFASIPYTQPPSGRRKPKPRDEPVADQAAVDQFRVQVREFMEVLHLECNLPPVDFIEIVQADGLVRPALEQLGLGCDALAAQRAIRDLVGERNLASKPTENLAMHLASQTSNATSVRLGVLISARSIGRDDVISVLPYAGMAVRLKHPRTKIPIRLGRLVVKMRKGGLGETEIDHAIRLRQAWIEHWESARTGLPGDADELFDLETRVQAIAVTAERSARTGSDPVGIAMMRELSQTLRPDQLGRAPGVLLEHLHLMGLLYDLSSQCHVWFSDLFDAESAAGALEPHDVPGALAEMLVSGEEAR